MLIFRATVPPDQILHSQRHIADLFSDELFRLARDNLTVEKVLRDDIDAFTDRQIDVLTRHALLVVCINPEGQAKIKSIIDVHYHIMLKLQLAYEPF